MFNSSFTLILRYLCNNFIFRKKFAIGCVLTKEGNGGQKLKFFLFTKDLIKDLNGGKGFGINGESWEWVQMASWVWVLVYLILMIIAAFKGNNENLDEE